MFEALEKELAPQGHSVFDFHPVQLRAYLDTLWDAWRVAAELVPVQTAAPLLDERELSIPPTPVIDGLHGVNDRFGLEPPLLHLLDALGTTTNVANPRLGLVFRNAVARVLAGLLPASELTPVATRPWQHLMYAYLVENTRIFDISEAVIRELLMGERLGPMTNARTHRWVRATEDLFYQPGTGFISSLTSALRRDAGEVRRNLFHRVFGIDLNHGRADGTPYPYIKAEAHNASFVSALEDVLRELWRGHINRNNQQGTNVTDLGALGELLSRLRAMLRDRRQKAVRALAREEFATVAMASWFKVLLASDNDIIADLRATASTEEERLRRMGERVGIAPHSKTRSLLHLADAPGNTSPALRAIGALPAFLLEIEDGRYENNDAAIRALFDDSAPERTERTLNIITHWSIATGHDLKSQPVVSR